MDSAHAYARLPEAREVRLDDSETAVEAWVESAAGERIQGVAHLTLVDDAHFPDPTALVLTPDGTRVCASSTSTDELVCLAINSPAFALPRLEHLDAGDGPTALARFGRGSLIAHAFAPELTALTPGSDRPEQIFAAPRYQLRARR